nr:hypothetical protein [Tanacetum cinerariifolium]
MDEGIKDMLGGRALKRTLGTQNNTKVEHMQNAIQFVRRETEEGKQDMLGGRALKRTMDTQNNAKVEYMRSALQVYGKSNVSLGLHVLRLLTQLLPDTGNTGTKAEEEYGYQRNEDLLIPKKRTKRVTASTEKTAIRSDGSNDRISDNCKCLLEEVFVKNANLFPAFAATQVDLEFIEETPPHELVKSPEKSTSSVRNISQSEGSSLSEELEVEVRVCIFEMAASRLLNMKEICFAQNYLTNSSWVATIFMGKEDMNLKRDFIIESMTVPEGLEKNKKKRSWM